MASIISSSLALPTRSLDSFPTHSERSNRLTSLSWVSSFPSINIFINSFTLPPAPSLNKEQQQVELELRLLEALEIYPPVKLRGVHRHFVLYGLMEFLRRSLDRHFSPDEVLQLLDRFYNLEVLKQDDEEVDILNHEEDFCLPQSYFVKEES